MMRLQVPTPIAVHVGTAALMLDTAPSTVRHWIKIGRVPARKINGRAWLIRVEDIDALTRGDTKDPAHAGQ